MNHISNITGILAVGDTLSFRDEADNILTYTVKTTRRSNLPYLAHNDGDNREIFAALDMSGADIAAMAQAAYGYAATGPKFPRAQSNDFAALTRLANAIFAKISSPAPSPAPVPAPVAPPFPAPVAPPFPAPVTVKSGKYSVTISLTEAGITIVIS
jgi:hypothetical protein